MLSHYDSAIAEAQVLHSRDEGCQQRADDGLYFSLFRKTGGRPSQKSYRISMLEDVVRATKGHEDLYISQSSFWKANRRAVNFKQTRAAWVDLDIYNLGLKLDSSVIAKILEHGALLGIPTPTAVIASGRGCYLKWIFQTPVIQSDLVVWNALQTTLTAAYSSLASDICARDASRVFRLLETTNSKSGETVRVIEGCGQLYDFGSLCKSVESLRTDLLVENTKSRISNLTRKVNTLIGTVAQSAERGDAQALVLYSELNRPIMLEDLTARSLNWARFCDLRDLYVNRGGIPVGQRDQALFWMLNCLSHAGVVHSLNWEREVSALLNAFPMSDDFDPLHDGSMNSLLSRLKDKEFGRKHNLRGEEVDPMYRASNAFLIDAFGITPEEMSGLSTLICANEKRNRADAKAEGRAERRDDRLRWRAHVQEAFNASQDQPTAGNQPNICITALAKAAGVERSRVSRYWSSLKRRKAGEAAAVPSAGANLDLPGLLPPTYEQAVLAVELARQAHEAAEAADSAAKALAMDNKMNMLRQSWARKKLLDLVSVSDADKVSESERPPIGPAPADHQAIGLALQGPPAQAFSHTESSAPAPIQPAPAGPCVPTPRERLAAFCAKQSLGRQRRGPPPTADPIPRQTSPFGAGKDSADGRGLSRPQPP